MNNTPVRSEPAVIRPFAGIEAADEPLEVVRLIVDGAPNDAGPVVLNDEEALANAKFVLQLPPPDEVRAAVEKTGVPMVDCGLAVLATGRSHRASKVLLNEKLRLADYPTEFTIDRSEADLILNDQSGFTLTVAIVLLTPNTPAPLRPHMPGTWLARREFAVSPAHDDASFSPEPLTQQIREHYKLPVGTLRYIEVEDVLNEESVSDAVHVYVDEDVLNLLLANPTDQISLQMQVELAVAATSEIAQSIATGLSVDGHVDAADLDGHAAAKAFIENLATTLKATTSDVLSWALDSGMLRSRLEAKFDLLSLTVNTLKET